MRAIRFAAALSLSAGLALSAGSAFAGGGNDRIDDFYSLSDEKCNDANEPIDNNAFVDLDDNDFGADGFVQGVGTGGDDVEISYSTDLPNNVSVSDTKGSVSQKEWSELCVFIDDPATVNGGRDTLVGGVLDAICSFVEKCAVKASVTDPTDSAKPLQASASANCSGTDLFGFLSANQVTSIQQAFQPNNKCGVRIHVGNPGAKSSISIKANDKDASYD